MESFVIKTTSPAETEALAARLAPMLLPGDTVALSGELGSGKTCFVRGLVSAFSTIQGDMVSSPTYAIMNEYSGTVPVYHLDCYRLSGADDALELGFDELFSGKGISLVEWPERIFELLPQERLELFFENLDEGSRLIKFCCSGDRFKEIVRMLAG